MQPSLSDKKVYDFESKGNKKVGNFEKKIEAATCLKVQVATLPNAAVELGKLVNNDFTLSKASTMFGKTKQFYLMEIGEKLERFQVYLK